MKMNLLLSILTLLTISLFAENRVALLIANGKYKNFSSLSGPTNEAETLSSTLKNLGFDVKLLENVTREQMLDELDNLKTRFNNKGGIAFFHYGGHAVQVNGLNYLIPVDADIPDEKKVATRAVNIDEVMTSLDSCGSDSNIVILDACRNNPLPSGSGRSASRGLSVIGSKPRNSIIVYSAEAGTVAQDGLFTPTLNKLLQKEGLSFTDVLLETRQEVFNKSNGAQIPGEYNQLLSNIYLTKVSNQSLPKTDYPNDVSYLFSTSSIEVLKSVLMDYGSGTVIKSKYKLDRQYPTCIQLVSGANGWSNNHGCYLSFIDITPQLESSKYRSLILKYKYSGLKNPTISFIINDNKGYNTIRAKDYSKEIGNEWFEAVIPFADICINDIPQSIRSIFLGFGDDESNSGTVYCTDIGLK